MLKTGKSKQDKLLSIEKEDFSIMIYRQRAIISMKNLLLGC